jgi:hypothetical protein
VPGSGHLVAALVVRRLIIGKMLMRSLSTMPGLTDAIRSQTEHPRLRGLSSLRWSAVKRRFAVRRRAPPISASWERSAVSRDRKFHVNRSDGSPLYNHRYDLVQEFHPPGKFDADSS